MNRLFRPGVLVLGSAALLVGAAVVVLWPIWQGAGWNRALPQAVPEGDQEIVWLNAATSSVAWERFVAAVRRLQTDQPELQLQVVADANAFPSHTTSVPELAVTVGGHTGRLWFRWYKLTGETGTAQWVQALAQRQPAPLAIIGGSSSDRARDLARELNALRPRLPAPLLLITTATADQVTLENAPSDLMEVYPQRSFRFCFTNRQMAEAVTDFIWSRDELRPDAEPVYLVHWEDDPYSEDLHDQFHQVLWSDDRPRGVRGRTRQVKLAARTWAWFAGKSAMGSVPPGLDLQGLGCEAVRSPPTYEVPPIPYSVGTFGRPNHWEAGAAETLLNVRDEHPRQHRPLLVLPATPEPGRRFLRALMRTAPVEASRFVVATGDGIDFDVIYRDRMMTWPVQDLPFSLVLFCHRNPVDPAAFQPDEPGRETMVPDPGGRTSTGTQDLLLYRDIVGTVARAAYTDQGLVGSADALGNRLREALSPDGRRRFNDQGNPLGGAGEHVVWLEPVRAGDRVMPHAVLSVWNRSASTDGQRWKRVPVAGLPELAVDYGSKAPAAVSEGAP